jgi:hypothetical protein
MCDNRTSSIVHAQQAPVERVAEFMTTAERELVAFYEAVFRRYGVKETRTIDLVCQRNFFFTFRGGKFDPLLKTRNAVVIYSRGRTYEEHSPTPASLFDHQKGCADFWLHFFGVIQRRDCHRNAASFS